MQQHFHLIIGRAEGKSLGRLLGRQAPSNNQRDKKRRGQRGERANFPASWVRDKFEQREIPHWRSGRLYYLRYRKAADSCPTKKVTSSPRKCPLRAQSRRPAPASPALPPGPPSLHRRPRRNPGSAALLSPPPWE